MLIEITDCNGFQDESNENIFNRISLKAKVSE